MIGSSLFANLREIRAYDRASPTMQNSTLFRTPPKCNIPLSPNPIPKLISLNSLCFDTFRRSPLMSMAHYIALRATSISLASAVIDSSFYFSSLKGYQTATREFPMHYTISPPYLCMALLTTSRKRSATPASCSF